MGLENIRDWSYGFVRHHETECVEYLISLQDAAADEIQHGNFLKASCLFQDIARGIEKLTKVDRDYYESILYAALYYVAKIEAFGREDRQGAIKQLERARIVAKKCTAYDRENCDTAKNDLCEIEKLLHGLSRGTSIEKLRIEFGEELLNPSYRSEQEFMLDNSISGWGCLAWLLILLLLCLTYSFVLLAGSPA